MRWCMMYDVCGKYDDKQRRKSLPKPTVIYVWRSFICARIIWMWMQASRRIPHSKRYQQFYLKIFHWHFSFLVQQCDGFCFDLRLWRHRHRALCEKTEYVLWVQLTFNIGAIRNCHQIQTHHTHTRSHTINRWKYAIHTHLFAHMLLMLFSETYIAMMCHRRCHIGPAEMSANEMANEPLLTHCRWVNTATENKCTHEEKCDAQKGRQCFIGERSGYKAGASNTKLVTLEVWFLDTQCTTRLKIRRHKYTHAHTYTQPLPVTSKGNEWNTYMER